MFKSREILGLSICRFLIAISILISVNTPSSFGIGHSKDSTGTIVEIPTPELNHVYIVLQQSSIDSIARTPFIREVFSAFKQEKVEADTESWFGSYLTGQRAYFEIYSSAGYAGLKEGQAGIGLSTRALGQIQTAQSSLSSLVGDRIDSGLRVRVLNNDTIPWFHYLSLATPDTSSFITWLMEFTEEYLHSINIKVDSSKSFDRHAYLASKHDSSAIVPTDSTLFDDIVEIDLELTGLEQSDFNLFARALGINTKVIASTSTYNIGNCILNVQINDSRDYCVRRVICSMIKAVDTPVHFTFGPDAQLEVHDKLATWHFGL